MNRLAFIVLIFIIAGSLPGVTLAASDTTPPTTPWNFSGFVTTTPNHVTSAVLHWGFSSDNIGVTGYNILRDALVIATTTASTTGYTDGNLTGGTSYDYSVAAFDAAGNRSAPTAPIHLSAPFFDTQAPTVPGLTSATRTGSTTLQIDLAWTSATDNVGVTGYEVLRDGVVVSTTTATYFTDTSVSEMHSYMYTVRALDAAGNRSAESAPRTVSIPDLTAPTAPVLTATSVSKTSSAVALSWTAATDAVGVSSYDIYRSGVLIASVSASTFSLTDTTAAGLTQYRYVMHARDAAGNISADSAPANVKTGGTDKTAPSIPAGLTQTATPTAVSLSWNPSSDNVQVMGYNVYRNSVLIASTTTGPVDGTSYVDGTVLSGVKYTYAVRAFDAAKNLSANSAAVSVVVPLPPDVTPPTAPSALQTSATTTTTRILLSWTAATDDRAVTGYQIMRDGVLIATTTGKVVSYSDTKVTRGVSYQYSVVATDAAGNLSVASNFADGLSPIKLVIASYAIATAPGTATISWNTGALPATGMVAYGTSTAVLSQQVSAPESTSQSIVLTGLTPKTVYYYQSTAISADGQNVRSIVKSFTAK
jgi:chitodextrinase